MDFGFYFKVFMRRLPYFLILLVLGTTAGVALAVMLPPVYRAEARLVVESEQIPDELAASTVRTKATEQLQLIQQRILTRDILLEMANRLEIYTDTGSAQMPADLKVEDLRARILMQISGGTRRGGAKVVFVTVGFDAPTSRMAAAVTNELVTLILRENVDMRTTVAGQTLDFFTQEVQRLDRELSVLSSKILEFQEENLNSLPDSLDFRRSQQASQQERLTQIQRTESILTDRRERLVSLFETAGPDAIPSPAAPLTAEAAQLQALRREYANSVAVLSLDNPKVAVLRSRIEALEALVAEQQAAATSGALNSGTGEPPSAYEIQLADIDGQLAFLAEQKKLILTSLESLRVSIEATPGNAVTLSTLQRAHDNIRTQYNLAVSNKARAETGDLIESLSKGERISVLEQAVQPREPTSPNRPLVAAAGVGGGLAAGLGLVLLLELLNSAVRRPADLTSKLGITALASVPYIWTRRQIWRRRLIITSVVLGVLVLVPAGLWLVDTQVMPLDPLINRLLDRFNLALTLDPALVASTRLS
ncbi:MAG: GumC family protein [Pseudooceanicola sp.]